LDESNHEENTYEENEWYITIDPQFWTYLEEEDEQDINHFLALPEIIPAKIKRNSITCRLCTFKNLDFKRVYEWNATTTAKKEANK
jgi:hypothetical protein